MTVGDAPLPRPLTVLVVDDHPVFRRGLLGVLSDAPDIGVASAVGTAAEAVEAVLDQQPDVVLMDLNLTDGDGIEVTRRVVDQGYTGGVLILTMYDDEVALVAALQAGARGYLLKGAAQEAILAGIRTVVAGGMVFGSDVVATVADRLLGNAERQPARVLGLSERETEILGLMASGSSNTDIARSLFLSNKTVRNHITSIFAKIGVTDRAAAIKRAREHGLAPPRALPW